MIPHAAITLAGAVGALVVAVIGTAIVARPVFLARLASCPRSALGAARLATVHVAVIAPAVYPELVAALLALSKSDIQLSSTRSKNWTPTLLGRILLPTCVDRSGVRRIHAAPRRLGALTPGFLPFYDLPCAPESPRKPLNANFTPGWAPGSADSAEKGTSLCRWRHKVEFQHKLTDFGVEAFRVTLSKFEQYQDTPRR
jgi:hypothetical protein